MATKNDTDAQESALASDLFEYEIHAGEAQELLVMLEACLADALRTDFDAALKCKAFLVAAKSALHEALQNSQTPARFISATASCKSVIEAASEEWGGAITNEHSNRIYGLYYGVKAMLEMIERQAAALQSDSFNASSTTSPKEQSEKGSQGPKTRLALVASWEIDGLAELLHASIAENMEEADGLPLRSMLRRIRKLACVVMSGLGDDGATPEDMREVLEQG